MNIDEKKQKLRNAVNLINQKTALAKEEPQGWLDKIKTWASENFEPMEVVSGSLPGKREWRDGANIKVTPDRDWSLKVPTYKPAKRLAEKLLEKYEKWGKETPSGRYITGSEDDPYPTFAGQAKPIVGAALLAYMGYDAFRSFINTPAGQDIMYKVGNKIGGKFVSPEKVFQAVQNVTRGFGTKAERAIFDAVQSTTGGAKEATRYGIRMPFPFLGRFGQAKIPTPPPAPMQGIGWQKAQAITPNIGDIVRIGKGDDVFRVAQKLQSGMLVLIGELGKVVQVMPDKISSVQTGEQAQATLKEAQQQKEIEATKKKGAKPTFDEVTKRQADILKETGMTEKQMTEYLQSSVANGGKLRKKTEQVMLKERGLTKKGKTQEQAVHEVIRDAKKLEKQATQEQKTEGHQIAHQKMLLDKHGKPKTAYRRLAKNLTGVKSMKDMTHAEAKDFIESLKALQQADPTKAPRIPTTTHVITAELASKIPLFQEIGHKERYRPSHRVFEKMGLGEVFDDAFMTEIQAYEELLPALEELTTLAKPFKNNPVAKQRMQRALEGKLSQQEMIDLSSQERAVVDYARKFYAKWAEELKLKEKGKLRQNYAHRIFERQKDTGLEGGNTIPIELARALDYITPKNIFAGFMQARKGKTEGLVEDIFEGMRRYQQRAVKLKHFDPLIKRIRVYEKFLPEHSSRYLRNYLTRITGRPLVIDREIQHDMRSLAKFFSKLPGMKNVTELLSHPNIASILAYNFTGMLYEFFLGLRPSSAIKNLGQNFLTISEVGLKNWAEGIKWIKTPEGQNMSKHSLMIRSRKMGYLPGVDETYLQGLDNKRRQAVMYMFKKADAVNVRNAFAAGFIEAKKAGLPQDICIKRGDEVARKCQYAYTKMASAQYAQSVPGRLLGVLTTWPENWFELGYDWVSGRPSRVYQDYERKTGHKPKAQKGDTRKELMRYLAIVIAAMVIQKSTKIRALAYTGWTSLQSIANMIKGDFAGLQLPGDVAQLLAGALVGDEKAMKQAWRNLSPERQIVIVKQLADVFSGKKDWLSLFLLMNPDKKSKVSERGAQAASALKNFKSQRDTSRKKSSTRRGLPKRVKRNRR